ncbi:MAG: Spy/CpxP family protein refolding chaperone [Bacteroidetes bacterium]|nr:Spy/CpxP family protein refolding chaperone [Bacteroidota bacterium]
MKLMTKRPAVLLVAGLLLASASAFAQEDGSIIDKLNLSDAQKTQIKDLRDKFRAETEKPRTELKRLLEEEKRVKATTPVNQTALEAVLKKRADMEIELSLALTRFNERLEALLTADQKKLLAKLREEKKKPH